MCSEAARWKLIDPTGSAPLLLWTVSARGIAKNLNSAREASHVNWSNQAIEAHVSWLTRLGLTLNPILNPINKKTAPNRATSFLHSKIAYTKPYGQYRKAHNKRLTPAISNQQIGLPLFTYHQWIYLVVALDLMTNYIHCSNERA